MDDESTERHDVPKMLCAILNSMDLPPPFTVTPQTSFGAKRGQGIEFGGSSSRNVTGKESDQNQHHGYGGDGQRVHRRHAIELFGDQTRGSVGAANADHKTQHDDDDSFAQNQAKNVESAGAKSCPD